MTIGDFVSLALIAVGCLFFVAGSVGMLRLPDVFTRLHATTKADNVGLGFLIVGLLLGSGSVLVAAKMILLWLLVLVSGATTCHLVAQSALRSGVRPWSKRGAQDD